MRPWLSNDCGSSYRRMASSMGRGRGSGHGRRRGSTRAPLRDLSPYRGDQSSRRACFNWRAGTDWRRLPRARVWDTEIYILPFFVFTDPPTARALLMYRYHTLDAARRKAKEHGYQGALYAWESADTGDETTPRCAVMPDGRVVNILTGEREHHISADIAYLAVLAHVRRRLLHARGRR